VNIPEQRGRVIVITGASSGIGRVTAEVLAERGARLLLLNRDEQASQRFVEQLRARGGEAQHVTLDLDDLDSVRQAARDVLARSEPLHVLINNAGAAGRRDLTRQGFEAAFGVNHLGHFLLTSLLLPKLLEQPAARVVNVSSIAHYAARGIDFGALRRPARAWNSLGRYQVSKLCNVLHARELARRYGARGLEACSLHPGVISTNIWRQVPQPIRGLMKLTMRSEAEGARTTLYCATTSDLARLNGRYFDDGREREPSRLAHDEALAGELWERSEAWTGDGAAV
jgi:NAD(P)-dependent dehydrogenase (short-subunit alcohol dehydrogenase family)